MAELQMMSPIKFFSKIIRRSDSAPVFPMNPGQVCYTMDFGAKPSLM